MNERFFSGFREKDYHIARSMRELYGYEPVLYVEKEQGLLARIGEWVINTFGGK